MADYYEQSELWDRDLTAQEIERIELVKSIIPNDVKTLLDAGCGNGAISNYLDAYEVTGVDRSKEALKYFKYRKVLGSLDDLPFEDNSFDIVICSDVLEHLPDGVFEDTINELKRVSSKYILIISPNREDLEANQCKCKKCDTVFHMNWHIKSLGVDDIISLFKESYSPLVYTYFGEKWSSEPKVKYLLQRSESKGYKHWENAVCPLCNTNQENKEESFVEIDKLTNKALSDYFSTSTELMMLLSSSKIKNDFFDFDKLNDTQICVLSKNKIDTLSIVSRQFIDTKEDQFVKKTTEFYPQTSYVLKDSNNNWHEKEIDNNKYIVYKHNKSISQHAIFCMPYLQGGEKLFVKYIDVETKNSVSINLFTLDRGYVNLGDIEFFGTQEVKISKMTLPKEFIPLNEGLMFEVVINDGEQVSDIEIPFLSFYIDENKKDIDSLKIEDIQLNNKNFFLHSFKYHLDEANYPILEKDSYIYNSRLKCLYWNIDNTFEAVVDMKESKKGSDIMFDLKQFIDVDKKIKDLEKINRQEIDEIKDELMQTKDELYTVSNTLENLLFKIKHPVKFVSQKVKSKLITEKKDGRKHLVVLTPDVKIDRRTVQMCQSLINNMGIRCTIIAALDEKDDFVTDALKVKRINPKIAKKYKKFRLKWRDNIQVDLEDFYWLHYQYLYMAMQEDADYIMCCDLPVLPAATYASKMKDIPLIYDAHELYPEQAIFDKSKREFYFKVEKEFIQYPNLVITVNKSIAKEMANRYNIKEPEVILNVLDAPASFDIEKKYDYFREKLPIKKEQKIVLFQGGYSPNRNLELFVKSAKYIKDESVVLVLMGFGEFQKELVAIAKEDATLDKKVFFLPAVEQSVLLEYSASADVGIIPYPHIDLNSYYCTPNKLFEFIQAGLPMIANDSPELNRFVKDNKIGYSKKIEDEKDIAQMIDSYFEQNIDYKKMMLEVRNKINWQTEESLFLDMVKETIQNV
jgi:glycosyltransferase involved in cell wall biosynthesis/SAM-dependent methyltransferase